MKAAELMEAGIYPEPDFFAVPSEYRTRARRSRPSLEAMGTHFFDITDGNESETEAGEADDFEDSFGKVPKAHANSYFDDGSTTGAGTVDELETELENTRARAIEVEFQLQQSATVGQFLLTRNEELEKEVEDMRQRLLQGPTASNQVSPPPRESWPPPCTEEPNRHAADVALQATLLSRNDELETENERLREEIFMQREKELAPRRGRARRRTTISCAAPEELSRASMLSATPSSAGRRSTFYGGACSEDFNCFRTEATSRASNDAKWQDRMQEVTEQNQALSEECQRLESQHRAHLARERELKDLLEKERSAAQQSALDTAKEVANARKSGLEAGLELSRDFQSSARPIAAGEDTRGKRQDAPIAMDSMTPEVQEKLSQMQLRLEESEANFYEAQQEAGKLRTMLANAQMQAQHWEDAATETQLALELEQQRSATLSEHVNELRLVLEDARRRSSVQMIVQRDGTSTPRMATPPRKTAEGALQSGNFLDLVHLHRELTDDKLRSRQASFSRSRGGNGSRQPSRAGSVVSRCSSHESQRPRGSSVVLGGSDQRGSSVASRQNNGMPRSASASLGSKRYSMGFKNARSEPSPVSRRISNPATSKRRSAAGELTKASSFGAAGSDLIQSARSPQLPQSASAPSSFAQSSEPSSFVLSSDTLLSPIATASTPERSPAAIDEELRNAVTSEALRRREEEEEAARRQSGMRKRSESASSQQSAASSDSEANLEEFRKTSRALLQALFPSDTSSFQRPAASFLSRNSTMSSGQCRVTEMLPYRLKDGRKTMHCRVTEVVLSDDEDLGPRSPSMSDGEMRQLKRGSLATIESDGHRQSDPGPSTESLEARQGLEYGDGGPLTNARSGSFDARTPRGMVWPPSQDQLRARGQQDGVEANQSFMERVVEKPWWSRVKKDREQEAPRPSRFFGWRGSQQASQASMPSRPARVRHSAVDSSTEASRTWRRPFSSMLHRRARPSTTPAASPLAVLGAQLERVVEHQQDPGKIRDKAYTLGDMEESLIEGSFDNDNEEDEASAKPALPAEESDKEAQGKNAVKLAARLAARSSRAKAAATRRGKSDQDPFISRFLYNDGEEPSSSSGAARSDAASLPSRSRLSPRAEPAHKEQADEGFEAHLFAPISSAVGPDVVFDGRRASFDIHRKSAEV